MVQSFVVKTERGRPDNIKEPVTIAFTLTPVVSKKPTCTYDPLARWVTTFPVSDAKSVSVEWDWSFTFRFYTARFTDNRHMHCWNGGSPSPSVVPGQTVTLTQAPSWIGPDAYHDPSSGQSSIAMTNQTGSTQNLMLVGEKSWALVAYHPLENGGSIIVPAGLKLQAYIVNNSIVEHDILLAEDLKRPIFNEPLVCNDLPSTSTWRLCQNHAGTIQLKNDNEVGLAFNPLVKTLTGSVGNMAHQLDIIAKSLSDTQQSLAAMGTSVGRFRDDLSVLQRLLIPDSPPAGGAQLDISTIRASLVSVMDQLDSLDRQIKSEK